MIDYNNLIERITLPTAEEFENSYMKTVTPVVITDLYSGEEIRDITSRDKVIEHWGNIRIPVQDEYLKAYEEHTKKTGTLRDKDSTLEDMATMTIAEYYRYVDENPNEKKMCIEFSTPDAIRKYYSVPEMCIPQEGESNSIVQQCFVGNKGNVANIHFDKAGHHGFLFQIFGRKRFIVFPHSAAKKLLPLTQTSGWKLQNFTEQDRQDFLRFTGGKEVILESGEAMFVPAYCWHYADYIEDSMAVRVRFRRPNHFTELLNFMYPDMYTQGILHKIADPIKANSEYREVLVRLKECAEHHYSDGKQKVHAIRELTKKIYFELYPEEPHDNYSLDLEKHFPSLLPHFLDAEHPDRPIYQ
ncbi:cupin-like domain-containing protein [Xenorhabdus sp. SGI246]|uniref:cupin-like domain-containing protein n=1 Tax=Xenorhabdus sp. SGI246 TaxID=3158263 RepID=UPI00349F483E